MQSLPLGTIVIGLLGGLALFLYGMDKLTVALKQLAGDRMRRLLELMTTNRFKGVLAGTLITATIQSSSVTTVLVVGFISAGLLSLAQAIPIIMGASIGTTVTAQIIAFDIARYALVLLSGGFALLFFSKKKSTQHWGAMVMGLGLLFFGMQMMKEATSPLRDYPPFLDAMQNLTSPLLAILFGALFTALVQSSSATTGIIIVLASQGLLSLDSGIALVLGANIGTCVTAVLAAIGKPREAARAAAVHVLFNTLGVVLWFGLIPYLADIVRWMSPVAEGLDGMSKLQRELPRQIANAHTVFNVSNTLIFIGFTPLLARLAERLLPDRKASAARERERTHLDDLLISTPTLALDVVRQEIGNLGAAVVEMARAAPAPVLVGSENELLELRAMDDEVDNLHSAVIPYLGRISMENLSETESHRLSKCVAAANHLENIGDMIETNLVDEGLRRLEEGLEFGPTTRSALATLHTKITWSLERAVEAFLAEDRAAAQSVIDAKREITRLGDAVERHLAQRLVADEPNRLAVYRVESELVEAFKRMYYHAKRIAKLVLDEDVSSGAKLSDFEDALVSVETP